MKVLVARSHGMCFGVRDALSAAVLIHNPSDVAVHGEICPDERVARGLSALGFGSTCGGRARTPWVLIPPRGVSQRERSRLLEHGRRLLDMTCPLVRQARLAARTLEEEGRLVVVLGEPGDPEVRGMVEDLLAAVVVRGPEDVRRWDAPRLGLLAQTTTSPAAFGAVLEAVQRHNPGSDLRAVDTLCQPTRDRHQAMAELWPRIDALVVVGDPRCGSARELCRAAERAGVPVRLARDAADLDPAWLSAFSTVGLTAGTSAPPGAVEEVRDALEAFVPGLVPEA